MLCVRVCVGVFVVILNRYFHSDSHPVLLPVLLLSSEYDLASERRRAEERAGDKLWVRRFPHERGNWPTYVFVPGKCEMYNVPGKM